MTAQDFLYQVFRKCGQIRPGWMPSPELLADGLAEWSALYDGFNAQRTLNFSVPDYIYPVRAQGSRTNGNGFGIGPVFTFQGILVATLPVVTVENTVGLYSGQIVQGIGIPSQTQILTVFGNQVTLSQPATVSGSQTIEVIPDFVGPRPEAIIRCNLLYTTTSPNSRIPLAPIGVEEWASISTLQLTPINVTTVFYYDPQFPQGVLNCWPPLNGNSLEIFTWGFLTPPSQLTDTYFAPPGYQDLIVYRLAQRMYHLCTKWEGIRPVDFQYLCGQAAIAAARVKAANAPSPRLRNDFAGGRGGRGNECNWALLLSGVPY